MSSSKGVAMIVDVNARYFEALQSDRLSGRDFGALLRQQAQMPDH
jgi:hypothetical protein